MSRKRRAPPPRDPDAAKAISQDEAATSNGQRNSAILFAVAMAVYLLLFYGSPLPSLGTDESTGEPLRRWYLFQFLLFPDLLLERWFGAPGERSLLDRLPILGLAVAILVIATLAGWVLMRLGRADRELARLETGVFSLGVGLNVVSLYTLTVGLLGWLQNAWTFLLPGAAVLMSAALVWRRTKTTAVNPIPPGSPLRAQGVIPWTPFSERLATTGEQQLSNRWLWWSAPFVLAILLGGFLPPADFDVREYHAQAPKEFYLSGRIEFLPHNVYANMALGTEILSIPAMALSGDWWRGSLAGKTLFALLAPATALMLYCAGRRLFSASAGVLAALAYISTPWVARVSTDGLVEGAAAFFLLLSVYAALLWREARQADPSLAWSRLLLAGFLSGAAVACKYPAALFVLIPLAAWVTLDTGRLNGKAALLFLAAALVACGPWFLKNAALTNNPTYPLLYELFDGQTRTEAKNEQWLRAHRPPNFRLDDLAGRAADVLLRSEWLSPLLFPLAAVALSVPARRKHVWDLALYFLYVIAAWWLLTHRIDRFWIPALPVVALLAGAGGTWSASLVWWRILKAVLVALLLANLLVIASTGYTRYFVALDTLRTDPQRVDPWHLYLNERMPRGGAVLLVGDAQPYDLEMPALYNTVFDDSIFEQMVKGPSAEAIRHRLAKENVRFIYVHWGEIERYRRTYGFTEFVQPQVFQTLVRQGVLELPLPSIEGHSGQLFPVRQ